MRNSYFVIFFLFVLAVHIAGIYTGNEGLEQLTKPMLLLILMGYFFESVRTVSSPLKKWIAGALAFSLAGDVLLLFVATDAGFFMGGLAAFLIAHVFYIFFLHAIRITGKVKGKLFLLLLVFIYYVVLMGVLNPWLGSYRLPVRIYSVIICFMLMLALHMLYIKNRKAGWQLVAGASLFVVSDSVLAINKLYISFAGAGIIIMLTYGLAQLLLVRGAIEYINGIKNQQPG